MDRIRSLVGIVSAALGDGGTGLVAIPLGFALGVLSALVSTCCILPVLGIIAGYAGTRSDHGARRKFLAAGFFVMGAALALVILGMVAAAIGQVAQNTLGRYWKLFAGMVAIMVGLGTMNLLPMSPFGNGHKMKLGGAGAGWLGALVFGVVGGGAVSVCSLACNPGVFIILGAAMLQGFTLWTLGILVAYALGFSLPLGALMLGISFATATVKFKGTEFVVRQLAGCVLIGVGFYFLWTF